MPEPKTPKIGTCALCGEAFEISTNRKLYCDRLCKQNAEYADPPEHAAMLEAMSRALVAAIKIDPGYLIEIAAEGAKLQARQAA